MKILSFIFIGLIFLTGPAWSLESVQVIVNGQIRSCTASPDAGNVRYYCRCDRWNSGSKPESDLLYVKMRMDTGEETIIKKFRHFYVDETEKGKCEDALRSNGLCR